MELTAYWLAPCANSLKASFSGPLRHCHWGNDTMAQKESQRKNRLFAVFALFIHPENAALEVLGFNGCRQDGMILALGAVFHLEEGHPCILGS